jgi:hypothetical protein
MMTKKMRKKTKAMKKNDGLKPLLIPLLLPLLVTTVLQCLLDNARQRDPSLLPPVL